MRSTRPAATEDEARGAGHERDTLALVLEAQRSDRVLRDRYRVIRVLRLVSHPGVPRVLDSFEHTEDGRTALVLVQELIEGHSLRTRVEQGPLLGEEEVVRIADGVLEILVHLHGRIPS